MFDLSPVKILIILIVALLVLGPDKLPKLARQIGAGWGDLRRWRTRVEQEVRGTFPDLPTDKITQAVRSPLSFLDRLADEHESRLAEDDPTPPPAEPADLAGAAPTGSDADPGGPEVNGHGSLGSAATPPPWSPAEPPPATPTAVPAAAEFPSPPDDPSMN